MCVLLCFLPWKEFLLVEKQAILIIIMEKVLSKTSGAAKKRKLKMPAAAESSKKNKRITSFFQNKDSNMDSGVVCLANGFKSAKGNGVTAPVKSNQDVSLPQPNQVLFSSENVVLGWTMVPTNEAAMENLGNTCYINSILQALFHIPAFANWLLNDVKHRERCEQASGPTCADDCLTCALAKTLFALRNNNVIRPELIVSKRKMICEGFENGNQEDAHEFMRHLLAKIENDFLKRFPQEMLDPYSRQTTPINQIFGGYFRSEVACDNCGKISTSFEHFQDLILDILTVSKMDQALDLFFSNEVLDGPNAYQCGSCNQLSKATKSLAIEKPPKVLCVQLKRFTGRPANKKILKRVEVKRQINFEKYLKIPQDYQYKLIATVTHKGNSLAGGHYTATAETASGNICLFDDKTVRTMPSLNLDNADAYILFYEHMDGREKVEERKEERISADDGNRLKQRKKEDRDPAEKQGEGFCQPEEKKKEGQSEVRGDTDERGEKRVQAERREADRAVEEELNGRSKTTGKKERTQSMDKRKVPKELKSNHQYVHLSGAQKRRQVTERALLFAASSPNQGKLTSFLSVAKRVGDTTAAEGSNMQERVARGVTSKEKGEKREIAAAKPGKEGEAVESRQKRVQRREEREEQVCMDENKEERVQIEEDKGEQVQMEEDREQQDRVDENKEERSQKKEYREEQLQTQEDREELVQMKMNENKEDQVQMEEDTEERLQMEGGKENQVQMEEDTGERLQMEEVKDGDKEENTGERFQMEEDKEYQVQMEEDTEERLQMEVGKENQVQMEEDTRERLQMEEGKEDQVQMEEDKDVDTGCFPRNSDGFDPFSYFTSRSNHREFSENKKAALVEAHPVQPLYKPGQTTINLPFDANRIYYHQESGEKRIWVSYCNLRKMLFCWVCVGFTKTADPVTPFMSGWGNTAAWKAGYCYRAVVKHELSDQHQQATDAFLAFSHESSIKQILEKDSIILRKKQVTEKRNVFLRIINIVYYLGRQGLALRGHHEESAYSLKSSSNHGNFLELVKAEAVYDPVLAAYLEVAIQQSTDRHKKHPDSKGRGNLTTFLSKGTVFDLLDVIRSMIQEHIRDEIISNGKRYSICVDNTQDVSVKEQASIVVRYVDRYGAVERLLDIVETPDTKAEALTNCITSVLNNSGLMLKHLDGYSFDGASNMSGDLSGVQARLRELLPESVYQHCYAHVLQLVMECCCSCVPEAVTFFDLLRDCPTTISESHKRVELWNLVWSFIFPGIKVPLLLIKVGKTRWWGKAKALRRLLNPQKCLLPLVVVVLDIMASNFDLPGKIRAKMRGHCLNLCTLEVLAVGLMFQKVFSLTEPVSQYLQDKEIDHVQAARMTSTLLPEVACISADEVLVEAKALATSCNAVLQKLNSNQDFVEQFGETTLSFATEAVRRRVPVVPKKAGELSVDSMRQQAAMQSPDWYIRVKVLIPIQDRCVAELRRRFDGEALPVFKAISFLNPQRFNEIVANNVPQGALSPLCRRAKVEEDGAVAELINFAKNYEKLRKDIQADFQPGSTESGDDVDLEISDESECDEEEIEAAALTSVQPKPKKRASLKCDGSMGRSAECKGCLRCCHRLLQKHGLYSGAYRSVAMLYKYALTLPCTQVTCERSFSKLKIVKSRFRSTMSSDTLRAVLLMAVERDIMYKIDPIDVLDRFARTSFERSKLLSY